MKERDKQNVKTVLPRIVVKFRDDVKIPHPGASEIIDFFSLKDSLLWRNFFEWLKIEKCTNEEKKGRKR